MARHSARPSSSLTLSALGTVTACVGDPRPHDLREGGGAIRARVWRLSLGVRFALAALLVLSAVFLVTYFQLVRRERQRLVASKTAAGVMLADVFARSLRGPLEFHDDDAIAAEMSNLSGDPAIRSVVVWGDDAKPAAMLNETRGDIIASPRPQGGEVVLSEATVAIARPVLSHSGAVIGEVRIEMSLDAELATLRRARLGLLVGAAVMALGTSALLVAIVRREIVLPLRRVASAAASIGRGELRTRADGRRRDEIGELAAAFNQMAASLEDRELRLESITLSLRELVDHMRQAIVAFDSLGDIVSESSREALRLFGDGALKGRSVRALLYGNAPAFDIDVQAFEEWLELAFVTPLEDWQHVSDLAPREVVVGQEGVPVTLEFRPMVRRGRVVHVMLLATDVSHERRLERVVKTKDEEYGRRLQAMRRLLMGGSQALVAFVESARARLSRSIAMIVPCRDVLPMATIDALFRDAHTVRGEARAFDMIDLQQAAEQLEDVLDELRAGARGAGYPLSDVLRAQLVDSFRGALVTLDQERDRFAEASPIGKAIFTQTAVQTEDLALLETYANRVGGDLKGLVDRLLARPLGESMAGLLESTPTWAAAEGKMVSLLIEHGEAAVDPVLVSVLPGILTHLVRNAIAHGIESPEERRAAGKPPEGLIRVAATQDSTGTMAIVVEDDGRGLDVAALRRLVPDEATSIEDVIFAPGVTTRLAADDLAGRGVGLDAVRFELTRIGYTVSVDTQPGRFTRFTLNTGPPRPVPTATGTDR
jgi:two-component system chemotaxis sensor kinase CheA